jgi:hypothetical protein
MRGVQKKKTFGWNLMKIYRIKFHDFIIIFPLSSPILSSYHMIIDYPVQQKKLTVRFWKLECFGNCIMFSSATLESSPASVREKERM